MLDKLMIAFAVFVFGASVGGTAAWKHQAGKVDKVKAEYADFKVRVAAEGTAAEISAKRIASEDQAKKEKSDNEYANLIAQRNADAKRLRNDRASSRYVLAAPASASRPELACFDRSELERALQSLDDDLSGLFNEGDTSNAGLTIARTWAASLRKQ